MNEVLRDFLNRFVIVYIDGILIFSWSKAKHRQHFSEVLQRLREHSLYLKAEKCSFHQNSIHFLGYAPLLCHPDPDKAFLVEVDTSTTGIGAVLSQQQQKSAKPLPCAFFSKKLSPAEQNYDIGNRELLAIKLALEEWRHWLEGAWHPFVVLTDHKKLQYLKEAKRLNPRQARWALFFTHSNLVSPIIVLVPRISVLMPCLDSTLHLNRPKILSQCFHQHYPLIPFNGTLMNNSLKMPVKSLLLRGVPLITPLSPRIIASLS